MNINSKWKIKNIFKNLFLSRNNSKVNLKFWTKYWNITYHHYISMVHITTNKTIKTIVIWKLGLIKCTIHCINNSAKLTTQQVIKMYNIINSIQEITFQHLKILNNRKNMRKFHLDNQLIWEIMARCRQSFFNKLLRNFLT